MSRDFLGTWTGSYTSQVIWYFGSMISEVAQYPVFYDVSGHEGFREVRQATLESLIGRSIARMSERELRASLPRLQIELRRDTDLMLRVESSLVSILSRIPHTPYRALQFPVNVRMLRSGPKVEGRSNRSEYSTELLHCDAWSGAPSDSFNHLLYVYTEPSCPYLEMYETLDSNDPLRQYVGDYSGVPESLSLRRKVDIPCVEGVLAIWPTYSPHRTVVPAWSPNLSTEDAPMRVSIDFRTRKSSPYEHDSNSSMATFANTKMNSLGVYWTYPTESGTFTDKIRRELEAARRVGREAYEARRHYIERFFSEVPLD